MSLALVMVLHWLLTGRLMAVSGRFTALVNRVRFGPPEAPSEMSQEESLLALQAATAEEFGSDAVKTTPAAPEGGCGLSVAPALEGVSFSRPRTTGNHVAFFAALLAGGFAAAFIDGRFAFDAALASDGLRSFAGGSPRWRCSAAAYSSASERGWRAGAFRGTVCAASVVSSSAASPRPPLSSSPASPSRCS